MARDDAAPALPGTPMLFQGRSSRRRRPSLFCRSRAGALRRSSGRPLGVSAPVSSLADFEARASLADRRSQTFERSKLGTERVAHAPAYALHADLLTLRRLGTAFPPAGARRRRQRAVVMPSPRDFSPTTADDELLSIWAPDRTGIVCRSADRAAVRIRLGTPVVSEDSVPAEAARRDGDDCWRIPPECALVPAFDNRATARPSPHRLRVRT